MSQLYLSRADIPKLTPSILMENCDYVIFLGLSVLFLYAPPYETWLFKITCILSRQVISLKKMVVSSTKVTNLSLWSPVCIPLALLSLWMKLASISAAILYNSIQNGYPWQTLCIRVEESHRRPFIPYLAIFSYCCMQL